MLLKLFSLIESIDGARKDDRPNHERDCPFRIAPRPNMATGSVCLSYETINVSGLY